MTRLVPQHLHLGVIEAFLRVSFPIDDVVLIDVPLFLTGQLGDVVL